MKPKKQKQKVIVVMPAYNAQKTLIKTYNDIPKQFVDEIILVDDKSNDKTVEIAKKIGLKVFLHPKNLGYGGNQKTCYAKALERGGDIIVMVHPDYQYDARLIPELIKPITDNRFDIMLGSRIRSRKEALSGGMPLYKYFSNRFLTIIENVVLGLNLSEYHTGFRAFHREVLEKIPFRNFSNDFVFDQEMTISSLSYRMRIGEIAIPTRYHEKQSSIGFVRGIKFVLEGFWVIFKLYLHNWGILKDGRFKRR